MEEALKTICDVNHWSYAVFWKIGCQNPKLLIWEDCYYQLTNSCPSHVDEGLHFLVNKMMMTNQVHVVGQGLVGRSAFSGNHEWIVSGHFNEMVYPPEVLSELGLQFSAGMQTVSVIPVMPHGVLQLGSSMAMMENVRLIQDVKTLILQLVCVPSPLFSGNTMTDEPNELFGSSFNQTKSVSFDPYCNMEDLSSNLAPDVLLKQLSSSYDQAATNDYCHSNQMFSSTTTACGGEDLFDAFGIDFKNKILNGNICNSNEDGAETFNQTMRMNSFLDLDCDRMFSASGSDHLLDAVVSAATQSSSENLSCRTALTNSSISSNRNSSGKKVEESCVQTTSYSGSQISSWVDQGPANLIATANSKPIRKKLKPAENRKPRPKDRQLIQDRLKELREIIPNGAKCSIDTLLEQTIKHMVFLQSVNKHADKLNNQTMESKIIDEDGGLLMKDKFEGGVTWAYEVGSRAKMCPVIVEDLHSPHQFLVEMVCEEQGLFLEIADIIRGMGLTILKGVIQKRNDKIWAHFAVEAKREITRMEIFVSLVRFMEHNNNTATSEGFDYNTFVHPTFDPGTYVLGN